MKEAHTSGLLKDVWPLFLLCFLAGSIYTYKLTSLSFENYDHFQFAKIADEMVQSGKLMALTYNGRPYMNKPHLLFWLIWLFSLPFGSVNTLSARLPAVLSAIGCVGLTYLLAKELFGKTAAFFSGLILLSSLDFAMNARRVRFDIMLAMFTALALYLLLKGVRSDKSKSVWYCAGGGALALAFLTKGPPALIHILLPFPLFLLATRKPRAEWKYLFYAMGTALGIAAIWFLFYVNAVGFKKLLEIFQYEFVERIDGSRGIQLRPFYYYFYSIPGGFLPWSPLIPFLIPFLWKKRPEERKQYLFPLLWFLPVVIVLSLLPPKETRFSFPEFPPLAILLGGMCAEAAAWFAARPRVPKTLTAIIAAPACIATPALVLFAIATPLAPEKINPATFPLTILFLLLSLTLTYLFVRSKGADKVLHAAMVIALLGIYVVVMRVSVLAAENEERSPYQALYYRNLKAIHPTHLYYYRFASEELDFYNRIPVLNLQDPLQLRHVLENEGPVLIFMLNKELDALPAEMHNRLAKVDSVELRRGKGVLLLLTKAPTQNSASD